MIHRHFRKVFLEGDSSVGSGSLLVVANHFSWWDGFFINYLNSRFWNKRFHVMMLEKQLKKRLFFRRVGAFSIADSGQSVISSLRYAQDLLRKEQNLVTLFPQGHFTAQAAHTIKFEKGAQYLIDATGCRVKMVVVLVDYFSFKKPSVFFYLKNFDHSAGDGGSLVESYNEFYAESLRKQNQKALLW
jgi:1-acyl-sn-glycerol-3-phosphate acyltransferase